jgi:hypothetical protein
MRKRYPAERARDLLAEADAILASGGLQADVCRKLGISHVIYERLRLIYGKREHSE